MIHPHTTSANKTLLEKPTGNLFDPKNNRLQFSGKKKYVELLVSENPETPVAIKRNVPAQKARGLHKILWFYKAVPVLKPIFKRVFRSILPG